MNETRNIQRYWIDNDSQVIVRPWTDEEYQNINAHTHIFEKYWSRYCLCCPVIPTPYISKAEAEHDARMHELYGRGRHKCVVQYRDHELICLEHRDEFIGDLGKWVYMEKYYR